MLTEPQADAGRLALDRAVAEAVRRRITPGPRPTTDADAIALRNLMAGLSSEALVTVRAVLGRIDAATGAPLVLWGPSAGRLAADRFGLAARSVAEPEQALAAVREGARALMDLTPGKAWWGRLLAEPTLRVVAALPDDSHAAPRALMIQRTVTGPTGDDRTFWATDSQAGDARIVTALGASGLAASPVISAGGLKLFMLAGYVQAEDGRLASAPGSLSGVIGAAPLF